MKSGLDEFSIKEAIENGILSHKIKNNTININETKLEINDIEAMNTKEKFNLIVDYLRNKYLKNKGDK